MATLVIPTHAPTGLSGSGRQCPDGRHARPLPAYATGVAYVLFGRSARAICGPRPVDSASWIPPFPGRTWVSWSSRTRRASPMAPWSWPRSWPGRTCVCGRREARPTGRWGRTRKPSPGRSPRPTRERAWSCSWTSAVRCSPQRPRSSCCRRRSRSGRGSAADRSWKGAVIAAVQASIGQTVEEVLQAAEDAARLEKR